jgi:hypothetical protein
VRHLPGFSLFNGEAEDFQIVPEGMNFNVRKLSKTITKRLGKSASPSSLNYPHFGRGPEAVRTRQLMPLVGQGVRDDIA